MAVKSLVVKCDFCETQQEVEFNRDDPEDSFFGSPPLPDEDWFHLEGDGDEWDFCSRSCLLTHLS